MSANAYSIASLIMLAADKRYISRHGEVMVHNPMVPFIEYANANELEKHISELRMLEGMLQTLYQQFANVSIEDIKVLMDNETYLSPDEAVARGFADLVIDVKPRSFEMVAVKNKLNMSKTKNMLNIVIAAVNGEKFVNQMYYNTSGDEIQIFQANPAKYGIGDKTSIEEGEVRLSDGTMLSIQGYEISNIEKEVAKVEEVVAEEVIEDAPAKEDAPKEDAPKEEESKEEEVIEEKPVAEFNEGPAPKEAIEEEKPKAVAQAIVEPAVELVAKEEVVAMDEPKMEEPKMEEPVVAVEEVATKEEMSKEEMSKEEMTEEVVATEEVAIEEVVAEEEIAIEEVVEAIEEEVVEEVDPMVEHQKAMDAMVARIEALEAKIGASQEFETLATEAIDTLARNTSSAFKPEARVVSKVNENAPSKGMSIFQRMRNK